MAKYTEKNISFEVKDIKDSNNAEKYIFDDKKNIVSPKKHINAIDIDWNNATLPGSIAPIKSTADLLSRLAYAISSHKGNFVYRNNFWTIGKDGYWYENDMKTEYKAVPIDGAVWSIGEDGYWYENGIKTNNRTLGETKVLSKNEYQNLQHYENNVLYLIKE